jgi:hypothetical protein
MKRSLALFTIAIALSGTVGCGHTPSRSSREVRFVMERDQVNGCTFLGRVTGSSSFGGISGQKLGKVRAEAEMRDKGVRMGADVILVHSSTGGFFGADSSGDAYRCLGRAAEAGAAEAPPEEAPAPVQGGCVKDTDCKGDRVCESGKCVNP